MFESALHRQVVLALALAALALSGASAGVVAGANADATAPVETTDAPNRQPSADTDDPETTGGNVSATVVRDGDRLALHPAPNQTVQVRTNASPGTTLQVVLREDGNFHTIAEDAVSADGTATVAFDLSEFEVGADLRFVIRHDQATVGEAPVVVTDPAAESTVTTTAGTTTTPTTTTATTTVPTTYDESGFPFTTTATATATTASTIAGDSTEDSADDFGVPGFGVPAALAGLVAALALARRVRA